MSRPEPPADTTPPTCDLLVIGGGINGAGIARDAAGRGLHVVLCEKDDLAAHTSSASTKLIHGGLRYLEHYEFALVRKALQERTVLLSIAPHISWPLRFVLPHEPHLRPAWLIRAGLWLYDHLASRGGLPGTSVVNLRTASAGAPLKPQFRRGFCYSDGWVDDARLVVLNALDARERGATVLTRTTCSAIHKEADHFVATLQPAAGSPRTVRARAIVNAAGPWAAVVAGMAAQAQPRHGLKLVKGSHIIVPRLFEHQYAYIFQNVDRRIVFAIPYEQQFTLIGTTDVDYTGDAAQAHADTAEIEYLCDVASRYFQRPVAPADVVHTYAGVRPLLAGESTHEAAATLSRDYALEQEPGTPPLLNVFGGKLTTYRRLAEQAVDQLAPLLGAVSGPWTATQTLPGGDLGAAGFDAFVATLCHQYPQLPPALLHRYARAYGSRTRCILGHARTLADLGAEVLPGVHEHELEYLIRYEWARSAQDILWRRSKLGLHLGADAAPILTQWLESRALVERRVRRPDASAQPC